MLFFGKKVADVRKDTDPRSFSPSPPSSFVSFSPVTADSVMKLINAAPLKQSDLDPWPTWLMKDCANDISPYISTLFNISLASGFVPPTLKEAYITPIIKKPQLERTNINNHRPISNLSVISKLLERTVCSQLAKYLNNNLMPPNQSAYRRSHSTETALTAVFSDIIGELDRGNLVLLSMLDLSATFDCVNHDILLNRMDTSYGILDPPLANG